MKQSLRSIFRVTLLALALFAGDSVFAQTNAYDDAYHYAFNSAGWPLVFQGTNSGFGFGPWFCATNGPNSHGFFTTHNGGPISSPINSSDPPGNNNNQHVWGLFANGGADASNWAVAYRAF